jgi:hypothetical protein
MDNFKIDRDQMKSLEKFSNMTTSFMFKIINWFSRVISFFSENLKLLYGLIIIIVLFKVGTYWSSFESSGIYKITTHTGVVYNTNKIDIKDGCVYFTRMNNKDEVIICGGYTITK